MDRKNWFHGQVVMEDELDESFEYVEDAEHSLAIDADCRQAETGDTPTMEVHGGIMEGGVVARNGTNDYVDVTACIARDSSGRRIVLPSAATVKITHAGDTTEGDDINALGNGAAITASCPAGQNIVCSLFLGYDEALADPRVDAGGSTVYFDVPESYHFNLDIGTSFTTPPGSAPTRASLANNKVLLTDLVLTNSGGSMQVIASGVCDTDQDWDDLTGNYATNNGRRADWFAADQGSDFPQNAAADFHIRGGYARDIIWKLIKQLQKQTTAAGDPAGAELIGAQAQAGAGAASPLYAALTLTAGDLDAQLTELLDVLNSKVARGSDTVTPPAGQHGLSLRATNLSVGKLLFNPLGYIAGSHVPMWGLDGHGIPRMGKLFHDDFLYNASNWDPTSGMIWGTYDSGSAGATSIGTGSTSYDVGGYTVLTSAATQGQWKVLQAGGDSVGAQARWYDTAAYGISFLCKFRIPTAVTDADCYIGLEKCGSIPGVGGGAVIHIDGNAGTITFELTNDADTLTHSVPLLSGGVAADHWYTAAFWSYYTLEIAASLDGGAAQVATITGALPSAQVPIIAAGSKAGGTNNAGTIEVDFITCNDANVTITP